jgi:hypothetical protein
VSVHNVDILWTDYLEIRIFAAFRRENARSVRKVTDFVDRHYLINFPLGNLNLFLMLKNGTMILWTICQRLYNLNVIACTVIGGAAFGAWSGAMAFGAASTGTAISALSGIAATNATLAFLGGGSLAAGGLGIAVRRRRGKVKRRFS